MLWNTVATSGIFLTPFLEKSLSCRIFAFVSNTKSFVIAFLVAFSLPSRRRFLTDSRTFFTYKLSLLSNARVTEIGRFSLKTPQFAFVKFLLLFRLEVSVINMRVI